MNRGSRPEAWAVHYDRLASMRPRFMNRGSKRPPDERLAAPLASMRPRFMNRGSLPLGQERLVARRASMRPRFMNRGSGRQRDSSSRSGIGFNEAPIHESGKCPGESPLRRTSRRLQ